MHDAKVKVLLTVATSLHLQEAGLLAAFLRQLEAAGGVPPGQLPLHVPGLVLEAHSLAAT